MSEELKNPEDLRTPEEVVREYARAWNVSYDEHEESLNYLYTRNHISHTDTRDMLMDEMTDELRPFFEAFPDMDLHVEEVVTEGNKVAVRYTFTGTMTGPLGQIPATGKSAKVTILEVDTCRDGMFHESWSRTDTLDQMEQMGLMGDSGKSFWY
jgi:predicted ester cyclase